MLTRLWLKPISYIKARFTKFIFSAALICCCLYSSAWLHDTYSTRKTAHRELEEMKLVIATSKENLEITAKELYKKLVEGSFDVKKDDINFKEFEDFRRVLSSAKKTIESINKDLFLAKAESATDAYAFPVLMLVFSVFAGLLMLARGKSRSSVKISNGYIMRKWLPEDAAEERVGALQVQHERWVELYGLKRANKIYRNQMIGTIFSYYLDAFLQKTRLIDLLEKWLAPPSK